MAGPNERAANERAALAEVSEGVGWHRRIDERVDVYVRAPFRVRVIWRGDDAISGGSRFQDDVMESYSRDLATVKGWLTR
jgi:hypothetical protein